MQHVLQHLRLDARHVGPVDLDGRQLRRQLREPDRHASHPPGVSALLTRGVVRLAADPTLPVEPVALRGRGVQPIAEGLS
jgi:hypothetical protein